MRIALLALLALTGCAAFGSGPSGSIATWWVDSARVPCSGVAPMHCLRVHDEEQPFGTWRLFYGEIEGFRFEPGVLSRIRVRQTALDPGRVPADGSSLRHELVEVLERRPDPRFPLHDIFVVESTSDGPAVWLEFDIVRQRYSGHRGCVHFDGEILRLDAKRLELGPATLAKADCAGDAPESGLVAKLQTVHAWRRDGLRLDLLDANAVVVAAMLKAD